MITATRSPDNDLRQQENVLDVSGMFSARPTSSELEHASLPRVTASLSVFSADEIEKSLTPPNTINLFESSEAPRGQILAA